MKIAVSYENGQVFSHLGKTKEFKIYEITGQQIDKTEMLQANGEGHDAISSLLNENDVDVVICGNAGAEAQNALLEKGIQLISGASGEADKAVLLYLEEELVSAGANCCAGCGDNSDDESCGGCGCGSSDSDCGGCGSSEGGCGGCGGCGSFDPKSLPIIHEGPNAGKVVSVHYTGTLDDGSKFDSSYDRNQPLSFVCGTGMMIPGFDKAVVNMSVGDKIDIHLLPEEAYGERDPRAVLTLPQNELPGAENLNVGDHIVLSNSNGQRFPAVVSEKTDDMITFDANHELAGKTLNFQIEVISIED